MKIVPLESSHLAAIAFNSVYEDCVMRPEEMVFYLQFKQGVWYEYRPIDDAVSYVDMDVAIVATVAMITFADSPGTAFNNVKDCYTARKLTRTEAEEVGLYA